MTTFASALWSETLKALRSKVPLFTTLAFCLMPLAAGFFMIVLKDPEAARSMGLITTKARLTAGTADWPAYLGLLAQMIAAGGAFVFSMIAAWIFGREFSDRTVKELLAVPTSRSKTVMAKFVVIAVWSLALTILMCGLGLVVGNLVRIPGYSLALLSDSAVGIVGTAILTVAVVPYVALFASVGRGYLPPISWTILTVVFAQLAAIAGWGDWFPWAVPGLFSGAAGPRAAVLGPHSYVVLAGACLVGLAATFLWWQEADQTR